MPVNPPRKVTTRDKLAITLGRHGELAIFYLGLFTGIAITVAFAVLGLMR